jgi:hypothetical protein
MRENEMFDLMSGASTLHQFLAEYGGALVDACDVLGGDHWRKRAAAFRDALADCGQVSSRLHREATALLGLLSLENVNVEHSIEASRFAGIDVASPIVEDLCLLTEAFSAAISGLPEDPSRREGGAA